ncbi:NaeI family type II restriction endonuclease [Streptomyces sp. 7N604]|uniref:NaeI family type II restriction endonuclease n=1 Tax=Streptomyces sp. 7N604 TaxID=3457415 RepID=UPI003FD41D8E
MELFDLDRPAPSLDEDPELAQVQKHILSLDPDGRRFATVLRDTIDQLLDGEHTGRYDWQQLFKTEKTHAGTLVEINLQREFEFDDGDKMDYSIQDIDVDCKYSQRFGGWMLPPESIGHLCLLVSADDSKSVWSAGLLRVDRKLLTQGSNRDAKLQLKAQHRVDITWLWHEAPLPENVLLHMGQQDRMAIFTPKGGQARLNELFKRAQRRRIRRNVVRTVAQQKDYMKRVRGNGGSRSALRPNGILIMGDYRSHQEIAAQLGLPVPQEGEFVSARVIEAKPHHCGHHRTVLDGRRWVLADPSDPEETAPLLPEHTAARSV